jgi:hypothetical protein
MVMCEECNEEEALDQCPICRMELCGECFSMHDCNGDD